jgi:NADH-quinone oxidoreductase subunit J
MSVPDAVFLLLSLMTIVPAALVVTVKNVFHAALYLVVSLTGVAGLFAMMGADFLFVAQLLVYSGGILILLLFVVLLSGSPKDWAARAVNEQWMPASLVSAMFVSILAVLLRAMPEALPVGEALPTTSALGFLLLRDMLLPFEAVSLVLLSALVGAVHFSKKEEAAG